MTIPDILDTDHIDEAAALLAAYYRKTGAGQPVYTGSLFNSWVGGGDAPEVVNRVTADDLVSVSFLALDVPGEAAFGILETQAARISDLLAQIPADLDMSDVKGSDFDKLLGDDSPALELWHVLRGRDTGRWGMGETRTSKLLARKRPRLIPIYDSVVGPLMQLDTNSLGQWKSWHAVLTGDAGLPWRLSKIRRTSRISDPISDIRVMDIVLWMYGKQTQTS